MPPHFFFISLSFFTSITCLSFFHTHLINTFGLLDLYTLFFSYSLLTAVTLVILAAIISNAFSPSNDDSDNNNADGNKKYSFFKKVILAVLSAFIILVIVVFSGDAPDGPTYVNTGSSLPPAPPSDDLSILESNVGSEGPLERVLTLDADSSDGFVSTQEVCQSSSPQAGSIANSEISSEILPSSSIASDKLPTLELVDPSSSIVGETIPRLFKTPENLPSGILSPLDSKYKIPGGIHLLAEDAIYDCHNTFIRLYESGLKSAELSDLERKYTKLVDNYITCDDRGQTLAKLGAGKPFEELSYQLRLDITKTSADCRGYIKAIVDLRNKLVHDLASSSIASIDMYTVVLNQVNFPKHTTLTVEEVAQIARFSTMWRGSVPAEFFTQFPKTETKELEGIINKLLMHYDHYTYIQTKTIADAKFQVTPELSDALIKNATKHHKMLSPLLQFSNSLVKVSKPH